MIRLLPVLVALLLTGSVLGQADIAQMRDLLERGYYNSAARLNGPALVRTHPDDPDAYYLYAEALYLTGQLGPARERLERALELAGSNPDPAYNHLDGMLRAAAGDPAGALQTLKNAFVRSRDYTYAMDWGRVAWQASRYDEALEAYGAAADTERGQREPWPHLNRGRLLAFLTRFDEAIAAYTRAIEVFDANDTRETRPSPAYVEAYYRLGEIYEGLAREQDSERQYRLAEDNYRAALTADPNYAPAIVALDSLSRRFGP